jgi:hypothetical protein
MMKEFNRYKTGLAGVLALEVLLVSAFAQDLAPNEPGVVYYADSSNFKALEKEAAPASGRARFSAKVKGPHASFRLATGQPQKFRVCSIDPTRLKLYRFRSTRNSRDVTITKVNIWIGGAKSVLSESEIPIVVQAADTGCFTMTTKEQLSDGEYGFSPTGEEYAYTFGVGEAKTPK